MILKKFFEKAGAPSSQRPAVTRETQQDLLADTALTPPSWRSIARVLKPFWMSEKVKGLGMLSGVLAMTVGQVFIESRLNQWWGSLGNALNDIQANHDLFKQLLLIDFPIWTSALIGISSVSALLTRSLALEWRKWETENTIDSLFNKKTFFRLLTFYKDIDNIDQRGTEDIKKTADITLFLGLGMFKSCLGLAMFSTVLWNLSGDFNFQALGHDFYIPGYLCWLGVLYAAAGTSLLHMAGKPLIKFQEDIQQTNADFRYRFVRLTDNAESIAAYNGEEIEKTILKSTFNNVIKKEKKLLARECFLYYPLKDVYNEIARILPYLPYIVSIPLSLTGFGHLGTLLQTADAFYRIHGGLSFFVNEYPRMAEWKATLNRLSSFKDSMVKSAADYDAQEEKTKSIYAGNRSVNRMGIRKEMT